MKYKIHSAHLCFICGANCSVGVAMRCGTVTRVSSVQCSAQDRFRDGAKLALHWALPQAASQPARVLPGCESVSSHQSAVTPRHTFSWPALAGANR